MVARRAWYASGVKKKACNRILAEAYQYVAPAWGAGIPDLSWGFLDYYDISAVGSIVHIITRSKR